jgi:lipopolysaccharide/colanic/teichoic acid biosynthesis glycosyltransferase
MSKGKRLFDILGASFALLVLAPLLLSICVLIWVSCGRPILLVQERLGLHGKIFSVYKFRTMCPEREEFGQLQTEAQRVTPVGRFLRKTSLDELPQLWNVLRGEMSLVGPRPLLVVDLPIYGLEQAQRDQIKLGMPGWDQIKRHELRPGITGWAQIKGRNAVAFEERFNLDTWYVENWSLRVDVKIICVTFFEVLKRNGTTPNGRVLRPVPVAETLQPVVQPVVEPTESLARPVAEMVQLETGFPAPFQSGEAASAVEKVCAGRRA